MLIDLTLKINPKNATTAIANLGHYGTHLDIMDNDDIDIHKFITTGKLIDIEPNRDQLITVTDISNSKTNIKKNDFVIFRSNWLQDHGYGNKSYFINHPHLGDDVIDYLISKEIAFIGLDFPGAQRKEKHVLVDKKCADHGIYIIENLNNLHLIKINTFTAYCFPMRLSGSTGIPIRVVINV